MTVKMKTSSQNASHTPTSGHKLIAGSPIGIYLGAVAALLSLVLMALNRLDAVSKFLYKNFGLPGWEIEGIEVGLLGVALLVYLQHRRSSKEAEVRKLLAMNPVKTAQSFFRIGPYTQSAEDQRTFERSDGMHEKVTRWILNSKVPVLFLTGDSGTGKSSLLAAAVLPKLKSQNWKVIEVRAWDDPLFHISNALEGPLNQKIAKTEQDLREMLVANKGRSKSFLLVIDQFEEFLISGNAEKIKQFAGMVTSLEREPIKGVVVLFAIRSDYQAQLHNWGFPPLVQANNWMLVGRFSKVSAMDFMQRSGLHLGPEALENLVESAATMDGTPGIVRPITLNVVGHVLSQGKSQAPSLDAGTLVEHYIEQVANGDGIHEIARQVLRKLVTKQSTKRRVSEAILAEETKLSRGDVIAVLKSLGNAALARPLDATQGTWELSHDFIAHAVVHFLGRSEPKIWRAVAAYAGPGLFGFLVMTFIGSVFYWSNVKRNETSKANVSITVEPDTGRPKTVPGYGTNKYILADYVLQVSGEDVQFNSLDYEWRRVDGTILQINKDGRLLGAQGFKVTAGETYHYRDYVWVPDSICAELLPNDHGIVYFQYTFNAVDMHGIPIHTPAILTVECPTGSYSG